MSSGWLVKLTTPILRTSEWYYSTEVTKDAAIAAVRTLPGNPGHNIEVVRALTAEESRAIRIDMDQIRENA
jgi:hypothetical protein